MSEKLKYLVSELNKYPFNKKYNLISFDSLSPDELLQVFSDVLSEIDATERIDIKTEEPEETTVRLLSMLRILKYNPGADPVGFRQGLVQGEKHTIHPLLEWSFRNIQELSKRAYLAKYLVKVEIPVEILGDADVAVLNEQYEALIDQFKTIHKDVTNLKTRSNQASELRTDIEAMEKEKEIVQAKIYRMERKLENIESKGAFLEAAGKLRLERERQRELAQQREREHEAQTGLDERYMTLTRQLNDVEQATQGMTPEDVVRKLEEQVQMNEYIANEKLPADVSTIKEEVEMMERVVEGPQPTQNIIDDLQAEIENLRMKLSEEMERNVEETAGTEERLGPFRQQAEIISRKKEEVAERYTTSKDHLDKLQEKIRTMEEAGGGRVLTEKEYKEYVANLKVRGAVYKAKRAAMASLVAESGVLARTLDILKQGSDSLAEAEIGEEKIKEMRENMTKDELLLEINGLNTKVSAGKSAIIPKVEALKTKRAEYSELLETHSQKKKEYDAKMAIEESKISKLEQEVKEILKEDISKRSEAALLQAKTDMMSALQDRANSEEAVAKHKDKLNHRIQELEKESEKLAEEQKRAREFHEKESKQKELWKGVNELLECKQKCQEEQKQRNGIVRKTKVAETLVLQ